MMNIGRLHVLTDTQLQRRFSHAELTDMAIAGGADTIQFRQKSGTTREMIDIACQMKEICKRAGVTFIVNDRIDIAIASDADGVHLGQDDFPVSLARRILGEKKIIGGSACNIREAMRCIDEGVDYLGLGPVYGTQSKDDAGPAIGLEAMKDLVKEIKIPVIAIGGINSFNAPEIIGAGAHGIAVISAVCCAEDPVSAARRLKEAL